jgi:hypothetical protein
MPDGTHSKRDLIRSEIPLYASRLLEPCPHYQPHKAIKETLLKVDDSYSLKVVEHIDPTDVTTMNTHLRIAQVSDKDFMWMLYQNVMTSHIQSIWGWNEDWQVADFDKGFTSSYSFIVETDTQSCGYVQLDIDAGKIYLRMLKQLSRFKSH